MQDVFDKLKAILTPYAAGLDITQDDPTAFYLDTRHIMANGKPLFFAAVALKKKYVSYHLMPVYVSPALLDTISEPLRKRMQGKSCFNFRSVDPDLFAELSDLTARGYRLYETNGQLGP